MTDGIAEDDLARLGALLRTIRGNLLDDSLFVPMEPVDG